MLMLWAAVVATNSSGADQQMLERMTKLYDQICLHAFPDDKAVEALMATRNAKELSREDVKVTMRDDPARAWDLNDNGATLWIEFPPYHACSVRWSATQVGDLGNYQAIAAAYEKSTGNYAPVQPYDDQQGDIHIHAVGEQRSLPNKGAESLFLFEQHITDKKRRDAGETGVSLRFVHQFAPPGGE
jgi:hypothetical protein